MSYADRLNKLKGQWKKDQAAKGGGGGLPAGNYQLKISACRLEEGKASFNKGHVQVAIVFEVATGPLKGKKQNKWFDLEAPQKDNIPSGISQFKGFLENVGLDLPSDLTEKSLASLCKELIGILCNCKVVVNAKGYSNVYVNSAINAAAESSDDEEESTSDETDEDDDSSDDDDDDDDDEDDAEEETKPPVKNQKDKKKPVANDSDDVGSDWDD